MRSEAEDRLVALLTPTVAGLGYDLVDLELVGSGHHRTLRLYIDCLGGITVDDCETVSRQVSAVLDVEDPLPGSYTLEVPSPGLDRPLVKQADFARFIGETIKVRMAYPVLGRRNFKGDLVEVTDDHVVVDVDNESYDLPYAGMEKARLVPRF